VKIESGIPIPKSVHHGKWIDTVRKMNIGDSVVVPKGHHMVMYAAVRNAGFKPVTRHEGEGSVRIWKMPREQKGK
jgi:hypothetical protein